MVFWLSLLFLLFPFKFFVSQPHVNYDTHTFFEYTQQATNQQLSGSIVKMFNKYFISFSILIYIYIKF